VIEDPHRYRNTTALRTALEARLRRQAYDSGIPLDRLRKEVAHQRLLARLAEVAPPRSWALKGGQALLARMDRDARATKDADTTWRAPLDDFTAILEEAIDTDLDDGFDFQAASPQTLTAETAEGGVRYSILALLDGREFERLQLDVNASPGDQRPVEHVQLRNLLRFAGIEAPTVPVIPVAQHLAEKLHAYTRSYGDEPSTRPRDLYDMLAIARTLQDHEARRLQETCRDTFSLRETAWPPTILPPPSGWQAVWRGYDEDHGLPWADLAAAGSALTRFWEPVIVAEKPRHAAWDASVWRWSRPQRTGGR
jgi:predicted nucleotidyltransferase component of viral defense system